MIATAIKEVKRTFDYDNMMVNVEKEVEAAPNGNDLTAHFQALYRQVAKRVRIHRYVKVKSGLLFY